MNRTWKKAVILAGIFIAAVGVYFIASLNVADPSETVYTDMEEPSLPVVYASLPGGSQNRLFGYSREMGSEAAGESLIALAQDRQLQLTIEEYGSAPLAVSYEIRSMDQERLVERTEVEAWDSQGGKSLVTLPIQNLLEEGTEYFLHILVDTELHGTVHYYSRILWVNNSYAQDMTAFAKDFSEKTLTGEGAETLATYLETSGTADNSSLGHVTIESSFSQLTWAGLEMQLEGAMQVDLQELDGVMGQVRVTYQVSRLSEQGTEELYDVTDAFTMKWSEKRIYLMDFDRRTNQVFSGSRDLYSGKRILLGIGNDDVIQLSKSANKRYLAFVFNRDLWCYDQTDKKGVKVFSFRSSADASGRSGHGNHGIRILSVSDEGDVNFLVYGYMNRGKHEGDNGVAMFRYTGAGAIEERFFAPSQDSYEEMCLDVETLSYLGSQDVLYLYRDEAVFGIDLTSNEYMVVTDGLTEGCFSISRDGRQMAWQEKQEAGGADTIHIMDFESGVKREVRADDGTMLRPLGFVQEDFVYGLMHQGDVWQYNGRVEDYPMYAVEIVNQELELQTRYEKTGYYVVHVQVEPARVHMDRLVKNGQDYVLQDSDTIVCNTAEEETYMEGIGWFASEVRRKVYFVQPDREIGDNRDVRVTVAKRITWENSEQIELKTNTPRRNVPYYAYGQSRLLGVFWNFSEALAAAYDAMGIVTDENHQILWSRVNRSNSRTIRSPETEAYGLMAYLDGAAEPEAGLTVLDARGCSLRQVLYFIDRGIPVAAYTENGQYVLLSGFDAYNVTVYDPASGETWKMGLNDGADYFAARRNDFVCALRY